MPELKVTWADPGPTEEVRGPLRIYLRGIEGGDKFITIKGTYTRGVYRSSDWNYCVIDHVPQDRIDEIAQNFLMLAEARLCR